LPRTPLRGEQCQGLCNRPLTGFGAVKPPLPVDSGGRGRGSDADLQSRDVAARGCSSASDHGLSLLSPWVAAGPVAPNRGKGPIRTFERCLSRSSMRCQDRRPPQPDTHVFQIISHVPILGSSRHALTRVWPPRRKAESSISWPASCAVISSMCSQQAGSTCTASRPQPTQPVLAPRPAPPLGPPGRDAQRSERCPRERAPSLAHLHGQQRALQPLVTRGIFLARSRLELACSLAAALRVTRAVGRARHAHATDLLGSSHSWHRAANLAASCERPMQQPPDVCKTPI